LLQGGVGLLTDQFLEALPIIRTQGRGRASSVGLGVQRVGDAASLEQAEDEGEADAEPSGDLALGALTMIDRRRDPLAKILRVGAHGCLLLSDSRGFTMSAPRVFFPSATRK